MRTIVKSSQNLAARLKPLLGKTVSMLEIPMRGGLSERSGSRPYIANGPLERIDEHLALIWGRRDVNLDRVLIIDDDWACWFLTPTEHRLLHLLNRQDIRWFEQRAQL